MIAATSGRVPMMLLAALTATSRVRSPISSPNWPAGSSPEGSSTWAQRTVAPARSAASTQGRTFASWSSRVTTISSPGPQSADSTSASRNVSVVMFGPRMTPSGSPPTRSATARRASVTSSSERALAGNSPPVLPIPVRYAPLIASMTGSGTWVPAAPSR